MSIIKQDYGELGGGEPTTFEVCVRGTDYVMSFLSCEFVKKYKYVKTLSSGYGQTATTTSITMSYKPRNSSSYATTTITTTDFDLSTLDMYDPEYDLVNFQYNNTGGGATTFIFQLHN